MTKADTLKLLCISAVIGALIGFVSDLFIRFIKWGNRLIWNDWIDHAAHMKLAVIAVSIVSGFLMGICVKYFGTNNEGIGFDAVLASVKKDGELGLKQIKRVVLNAYPGLVTGASIGPEAPLITVGGYCGDILAKALKTSKKQLMAFITIALGGSMGVLVDSPAAGPILFAEAPPTEDKSINNLLVSCSMLAASIGFGIYYELGATLITDLTLVPKYGGFKLIHLLYGLIIGILGTLIGFIFRSFIYELRTFTQRFDSWPVYRGAVAGLIIGVIGAAYPLTMFDGSEQLSRLVATTSTYTVASLLILAVVRLVSTSVALSSGYQGGNIFPSIFIAGAAGLAVHAAFSFIPAPVAMVSLMASVMYVFTPLPLFCIFLFTELSSSSLIPVMAMSLVSAYVLTTLQKARNTAKA